MTTSSTRTRTLTPEQNLKNNVDSRMRRLVNRELMETFRKHDPVFYEKIKKSCRAMFEREARAEYEAELKKLQAAQNVKAATGDES